jgi:ribosomal protein S18 acetylase RimI-like enzyme
MSEHRKPSPRDDLLVRPYRDGDGPDCARIYALARRSAFTWCNPALFQPEDFYKDSVDESIHVAELDGRIAGFLSLWTAGHFVHMLFVDPALYRRGVGSRLLDHAAVLLAPWAWLKCQQQNTRALAFYQSRGWVVGAGGDNEIGPWVAVSWNAQGRVLPRA